MCKLGHVGGGAIAFNGALIFVLAPIQLQGALANNTGQDQSLSLGGRHINISE